MAHADPEHVRPGAGRSTDAIEAAARMGVTRLVTQTETRARASAARSVVATHGSSRSGVSAMPSHVVAEGIGRLGGDRRTSARHTAEEEPDFHVRSRERRASPHEGRPLKSKWSCAASIHAAKTRRPRPRA